MKDKNQKGKTEYISLYKAAKNSGYAQDYLSLLCRQGKLKGEKIGRNWVTTYQWLDEYQQNLIADMALKKNSVASKKDFEEIENIEKITEKIERIKFFESIKIACSRLLQQCKWARPQHFASEVQRCGRAKLVFATSLFFLILLGGFTYAKNPQFFSDFTEQAYQTKNQIAYWMSGEKDNLSEIPSVGDSGHSMSGISDGQVAGVNDSVIEEFTEVKLLQNLPIRIADTFIFAGRSLANGFNNFSQKTVGVFGSLKKNIQLAISDVRDVFERGIILCKTTLTIQSGDQKFDEKISDKFTEQNQMSEDQKQKVIQISSKELSEGIDNQMREVLIVAPDPESEEEKEKLKERIELSFSDEVKVKPEDKTSGIITPIFREREDNDYLYLLVPMKEERAK